MSLAIVQHAPYSSGAGTVSAASFTLSTTPVVGNVLIVVAGYTSAASPSIPAGWTQIDIYQPGNASLSSMYRLVQPGDGTSWNLTLIGISDAIAAVMYELSGEVASGLLVNQHTLNNNSSTSIATTAASPTRIGCLALAVMTSDNGSTAGADGTTVTAGWTIDERPFPTFHGLWAASKNALLTDNASVTTTFSGMVTGPNAVTLLLIAPDRPKFRQNTIRPHLFSPGLAR